MTARNGRASKRKRSRTPFENVRDQIGPCGLWCGSCAYGNGTITGTASALGKLIKDYGIEEWGPSGIDYAGLHAGLASVGAIPPCPGCLRGGGRADCEMRACSGKRGLKECAECDDVGMCANTKILMHMRTGAAKVGMSVKEEPGGRKDFLIRAERDLRRGLHSSVLFPE
ncbi:MAG: DUF3795 domain-containing protein [Thermoplasmata archaeon]|jgi:hypothetical protein|nr:DUF3795 domain-containing protein [Thermoplasmata archaeon]